MTLTLTLTLTWHARRQPGFLARMRFSASVMSESWSSPSITLTMQLLHWPTPGMARVRVSTPSPKPNHSPSPNPSSRTAAVGQLICTSVELRLGCLG